ncbi:Hypothetical predicted protein [Mytilus galloprovincialis]|uniref:Glycosyltransferase family 92 protein n=2 Tax=Mytilus galloprovincialis TaxID=29158 RepID=A0A8B6EY81_MYTGA|nr:Hypothetical predicted protein [Mytilus galloprovincialis]
MRCPRLKTIAILVFCAYLISIMIAFYLLHNMHTTQDSNFNIRPDQVIRHMKSHRRPEQLRIGHPLFDNCMQNQDYEELLLRPYHTINSVYVYSAFFDNRTGIPHVRMISMINGRNMKQNLNLSCNFAYGSNKDQFFSEPLIFYEMCENHHFTHGGWILSCKIPMNELETIPCNFVIKNIDISHGNHLYTIIPLLKTSSFRREKGKEDNGKFGLCIPPLYGDIQPTQFLKFISLTNALGIDHLIFYVYNISSNLNSILEYLEDRSTITIIPWILPVESNHVWYYGQSVAINDCLYRGMFYFKYLAFSDLDEYIVSHNSGYSLRKLIEQKKSTDSRIAAFRFRTAFFIRNPEAKGNTTFDVLEHNYRTEGTSKIRSKLIVEPYKIFEVGIHHVSRAWPDSENYTSYEIDHEDAIVHHYRTCTSTLDLACTSFITDSTIRDWHNFNFITRYNSRMKELKSVFNITGDT